MQLPNSSIRAPVGVSRSGRIAYLRLRRRISGDDPATLDSETTYVLLRRAVVTGAGQSRQGQSRWVSKTKRVRSLSQVSARRRQQAALPQLKEHGAEGKPVHRPN